MAWYSINKLSVTQNSPVVTGTGTQFSTFVYPGFGIFIEKVPYEVASVDSLTQITLTEPYKSTSRSDASYSVWPTQSLNYQVWQGTTELMETFAPLRNNMNLLTQQIADTAAYKDQASASAGTATTKASEAANSAGAAAGSATAAAGSASAAAGSASTATSKATAAGTSATNAATSASEANASKQAAASSAADALSNKNQTDTLKSQAITAKDTAVAAQTASEAARDASVVAKGQSENARDLANTYKGNAQTAQAASEAARDKALEHRNAAAASAGGAATSETNAAGSASAAATAKSGAETARDAAVSAKSASESARDTTVSYKDAANTARQAAENAQAAAELAAEQAAEPVNEYAVKEALGYTPVQQGTGIGQNEGNVVKIGWNGTFLKATVDVTDQGSFVFDQGLSTAAFNVNGYTMARNGNTLWGTDNDAPLAKLAGATFTGAVSVPSPLTVLAEDGNTEGGQIVLKRAPNQGTNGDLIIDYQGNGLRVFNGSTTSQMLYYDAVNGQLNINGRYVFHDARLPTKSDVGLGSVDNTSDANKPISTATQNALNTKAAVNTPTFNNSATVSGAANSNRLYWAATSGVSRWSFGSDAAVENGSNSGSDFSIHRYSDNGTWLGQPMAISRSTGRTQFNAQVSIIDGNQLLLKANTASNPTLIHRNDGSVYYHLISGSSTAPNDQFNGLRPLSINLSSGRLSSANGQDFSGGTTVNGALYVNDPANALIVLNKTTSNNSDTTINFQRNGVPKFTIGDSGGNNIFYINRYNTDGSFASTPLQIRSSDGQTVTNGLSVTANLDVAGVIYTGGNGSRNSIRIGDDVWLGDINVSNALNIRGEQDSNQGWLTFANSQQRFGRGSNGDYFRLEGDLWVQNWMRIQGNNGLYWENHGRGIRAGGIDAAYGNVDVYGSAANNWAGYSIGTWSQYMSNFNETGFYSQQRGIWQFRIDNNNDAWFPANVVAYSDERLKRNMRPIDNVAARRKGMAKAAMLYERTMNAAEIAKAIEENKPAPEPVIVTRVGFGAQTLEPSNPEVVKTADDAVGTKSVNYSDLVAVLAVDADNQADEIEALKTENAQLRAMLDAMEKRLTKAGI